MTNRREARGGRLGQGVVLASFGFDEAIERIIGKHLLGADVGVVEEHPLLGLVADLGDVSRGVVVVAEVLDLAEEGVVVRPRGVDPPDAKAARVVLEGRDDVVAVVDLGALVRLCT